MSMTDSKTSSAPKAALDAMLRADGRPPPLVRETVRQLQEEQGQRERTIIGSLQEMQARDFKDYSDLIQSLRDFAAQKRADLEHFERLLGNVERGKRQ